ncbi:MAG: metallophosphoesterase [Dehalococcoidia bacterium]|nr:metallophosphoesterase [Dehalococcoidia bacterium]
MIKKALLLLLLVAIAAMPGASACSSGLEFPNGISGTVFDDANANGIRDEGEKGVKGVLVSNGTYCRSTNSSGEYNLPAEGSFIFMTTPRDYTPTRGWYAAISSGNADFGLKHTPEKDSSDFTFVQITDIHVDEDVAGAVAELVGELNNMAPAFVLSTGDLIAEGNGATIAQAERWFAIYDNLTSVLSMPIYNTVGNHDVVGISRNEVDSNDPGYAEGLFTARFGPTYYSFDWGQYHCIILDPNDLVDGKQVYRISATQLQWLKEDVKRRKDRPLLIFFHGPTASWKNRDEVLSALKGRSVKLFCGHLHQDIMTDAADVSEQITGAVSGEWWHGANPDGKPAGYRIVSVRGEEIDSLYKGTGQERTIDPGLTPIVNGQVEMAVKIHTLNGPVNEARYQIDDGETRAMVVENGRPWAVATANWDTASLAEGYHYATFTATDAAGSFQRQVQVKVSDSGTVSVSDLTSHWRVYQGSYVSLEGNLAADLIGPSTPLQIPDGMGLLLLQDAADRAVVIAGECFSPPLSDVKARLRTNQRVVVKAVPLRLTMAFLVSTREYEELYSGISKYINMLPDSALEGPAGSPVAIWGSRWLSADDLLVPSE